MGLPMAQSLARAGYEVWGLDVRDSSEFGDFEPRMVDEGRLFSERVGVVISVVRDAAQTRALCFSEQALFTHENYPRTLVLSSTLSPRFVEELRLELPADVILVDAPMSGAPFAARESSLSFMLGGDDADIDALMPLFETMGSHVFRLGALGAGMTAKVLNNYVATASVVAVRRAYKRAQALNVDVQALRRVMAASSGATWFGSNFDAVDWSHEGYSQDNTLGILNKDIRCGLDAVEGLTEVGPDEYDAALLAALHKLGPFNAT